MNCMAVMAVIVFIALFYFFPAIIDFFSADALLRAPGLTGENAALQSAVESAVGKDISLFTPLSGEYRASYILFDADGDNKDEAVVFYSLNSNVSVVHMMLLSNNEDNKWVPVADIIGSGTEVYKVDFCNADTSQALEIAVMWSHDDSKREKTLSLYRINSLGANSENPLTSVVTVQLIDYLCFDIDSDAINELLYFYFTRTDEQYSVSARLLDYIPQDSAYVPTSDIALSLPLSSVFSMNYQRENNNYLIYLDCVSPDGNYFTEIITYDYENAALNKAKADDKFISSLTIRNNDIACNDFNDDGIIDIPCQLDYEDSYVMGYSDESPLKLRFVSWCSFSDNDFYEIGKYYINDFDGFFMKIDDFYDKYYFVYDYENSVTQVRLRNYSEENNVVFSIISETVSSDFNMLLQEGIKKEYNIIITAKGESLSFTEAYVNKLIQKL